MVQTTELNPVDQREIEGVADGRRGYLLAHSWALSMGLRSADSMGRAAGNRRFRRQA
jgi:hypothetical protein